MIYLILSAGLKMLKGLKKSFFNVSLLIATVSCMIGFSLFAVRFSTVFYILISGCLGLVIYLVSFLKTKKEGAK